MNSQQAYYYLTRSAWKSIVVGTSVLAFSGIPTYIGLAVGVKLLDAANSYWNSRDKSFRKPYRGAQFNQAILSSLHPLIMLGSMAISSNPIVSLAVYFGVCGGLDVFRAAYSSGSIMHSARPLLSAIMTTSIITTLGSGNPYFAIPAALGLLAIVVDAWQNTSKLNVIVLARTLSMALTATGIHAFMAPGLNACVAFGFLAPLVSTLGHIIADIVYDAVPSNADALKI